MRPFLAIVLLLFCAVGPARAQVAPEISPAPAAARPSLVSHRAVYDLSLARVGQGEGARAAKGTLVYTLTDRCDGYTIETESVLQLAFASGIDSEIEQRFAAWEAKDGRSTTFRMQVYDNGKLSRAYHGQAKLAEDGAGKATYESDSVATFDLPRGTLLSTAHLLTLLKGAAAGEKFVSRTVFDGSFDEGPFRVTVAIGSRHNGEPAQGRNSDDLKSGGYWPFEMAYFPLAAERDTPEYELSTSLFDNGVTRAMTQDFGNFAMAFQLVRVDQVAPERCP